jgi:cytoskeleton protein RodZ
LIALENGDLNHLPSPVQGRGMLKNYASFLGMDPEPILLQFADGLQARLVAQQAAAQAALPAPRREPVRPARPLPGPLQRLLSGDILIGALLSIVLIGFIIWGAARILRVQADNLPSPTSPSIAEVLLITPSATPSPTPPPAASADPPGIFPGIGEESPTAETPAVIALPASQQRVQVYISVYQRAYLQVWVDGEEEFQGRVLPGSAYNYEGEERVELLTSNGAALQVFYNQQDQGILGLFGQPVHIIYTLEGLQTPTPTITATSTTTPRPSPTPRQTSTPEAGAPALP